MSISTFAPSDKAGEFLRAESELIIEQARQEKADRNKNLGDPIALKGTPIDVRVRGDYAWTAENGHIIRKSDLKVGETVQIYQGHAGPVTSIAFCDSTQGSSDAKYLISCSWDKTIKIWDTDTKALISSTPAHSDFVKTLLVLPAQRLLVSGGSDKVVRFWDLSSPHSSEPLTSVGSILSHTRPIEALEVHPEAFASPDGPFILFTSDTMGVIRAWEMCRIDGGRPTWKASPKADLHHHRTGVTQLKFGDGHLWSASTDETVQVLPYPPSVSQLRPYQLVTEKRAVKAILPLSLERQLGVGSYPYLLTATEDVIRVYDVSSLSEPEFVREVEGHWHDVTRLQLWLRTLDDGSGKEVWIVSAGLDKTLRRWPLADLLQPSAREKPQSLGTSSSVPSVPKPSALTEEEERELAELMDED
ncbi:WD40-repeat-containing domain protein [Vararia minispora EC-137]|uniref:WD40-repeat-containing domain protein n=1 Tax=Vararia minispora EC-137 TaxID=1314806 RepID=A0ACB8QVC0_9AGAM|nr:WD40-repeat-containing domain protein [Vararia minispora EC-137]